MTVGIFEVNSPASATRPGFVDITEERFKVVAATNGEADSLTELAFSMTERGQTIVGINILGFAKKLRNEVLKAATQGAEKVNVAIPDAVALQITQRLTGIDSFETVLPGQVLRLDTRIRSGDVVSGIKVTSMPDRSKQLRTLIIRFPPTKI